MGCASSTQVVRINNKVKPRLINVVVEPPIDPEILSCFKNITENPSLTGFAIIENIYTTTTNERIQQKAFIDLQHIARELCVDMSTNKSIMYKLYYLNEALCVRYSKDFLKKIYEPIYIEFIYKTQQLWISYNMCGSCIYTESNIKYTGKSKSNLEEITINCDDIESIKEIPIKIFLYEYSVINPYMQIINNKKTIQMTNFSRTMWKYKYFEKIKFLATHTNCDISCDNNGIMSLLMDSRMDRFEYRKCHICHENHRHYNDDYYCDYHDVRYEGDSDISHYKYNDVNGDNGELLYTHPTFYINKNVFNTDDNPLLGILKSLEDFHENYIFNVMDKIIENKNYNMTLSSDTLLRFICKINYLDCFAKSSHAESIKKQHFSILFHEKLPRYKKMAYGLYKFVIDHFSRFNSDINCLEILTGQCDELNTCLLFNKILQLNLSKINTRTSNGYTVLMHAIANNKINFNNLNFIESLLKCPNINIHIVAKDHYTTALILGSFYPKIKVMIDNFCLNVNNNEECQMGLQLSNNNIEKCQMGLQLSNNSNTEEYQMGFPL